MKEQITKEDYSNIVFEIYKKWEGNSDLNESDKRELRWFDNLSQTSKNIILRQYDDMDRPIIQYKINQLVRLVTPS